MRFVPFRRCPYRDFHRRTPPRFGLSRRAASTTGVARACYIEQFPFAAGPTPMAQRKLDVVLDSVKRLLRVGATANLVNLLQKQHPADLAQLFSELAGQGPPVGVLAARRAQQPARDGGAERARARRRRARSSPAGPRRRLASCSRSCRPTTRRRSSTTCRRSSRRRSSS